MMCDDCGTNPASIRLTTIVQGERKEKNICPDCMRNLQKSIPAIDISSLTGLLSGFLQKSKVAGANKPSPAIKCDRCGMTYETFEKIGLLGCANCYQAFREPLGELLTRVHGNIQHAGRVPEDQGADMSIRLNVDKLKQALTRAIAEEEYETAAQLRDEIRALNAQLDSPLREEAP